MSHLTPAQTAHLEDLLRDRTRVLREEIRTQLLQSDVQHHIDLSGLVHDEADDAVAGMLADLDLAAVHRDVGELREVEAAVGRLAADSYGVCASCGTDIPYARLAAQPAARRCVTCEAQHERLYVHDNVSKL
jgi:DnaK suppressor protein